MKYFTDHIIYFLSPHILETMTTQCPISFCALLTALSQGALDTLIAPFLAGSALGNSFLLEAECSFRTPSLLLRVIVAGITMCVVFATEITVVIDICGCSIFVKCTTRGTRFVISISCLSLPFSLPFFRREHLCHFFSVLLLK